MHLEPLINVSQTAAHCGRDQIARRRTAPREPHPVQHRQEALPALPKITRARCDDAATRARYEPVSIRATTILSPTSFSFPPGVVYLVYLELAFAAWGRPDGVCDWVCYPRLL